MGPGSGDALRRPTSSREDGAALRRKRPETGRAPRRLTIDETWRITAMTDAAAAWFGVPGADALIGVDARKLLPRRSPGFTAIEVCMATRRAEEATFGSDFHPDHLIHARFEPSGKGVQVSFREATVGRRRPHGEWPGASSHEPAAATTPADAELAFTMDADWRITSISKAAAAWAGSTPRELIGSDGRQVNPAATALLGDAIAAALTRGETKVMERPSTHVPGRMVRIKVEPAGAGVRISFVDITTADTAEAAATPIGALGPAEIALLDRRGRIVAVNAAWRAAIVALGVKLADAGVGARYVDVGKAALKQINEVAFEAQLDELLAGRVPQFEATYAIETRRGEELRQVRIAPLRIGETTYFAAIHEDLSERARILATLNETSDQLLHAQESERQRIAVELHDSMSQYLAGLVMGLSQLRLRLIQDQRAQAMIDDMSKLTQLAIRETRVLSYLMNASGDERGGLVASVRRFIDGFGRRTGLTVTFTSEGPVDDVVATAQHAIFRVIQEALSNVYRHAHAAKVSVSLVSAAGELKVRVADDGRGLGAGVDAQTGAPPLGVGIPGMRSRIEQLGGRLELGNGVVGAVLSAVIPVPTAPRRLAAAG